MEIGPDVREYHAIKERIKRLSEELKHLRKRRMVLEENIQKYITENDLPGVRDGDFVIYRETKTVRTPKKKKEKITSIAEVLSHYIRDPSGQKVPQVTTELLESLRGETVQKEKLVFSSRR